MDVLETRLGTPSRARPADMVSREHIQRSPLLRFECKVTVPCAYIYYCLTPDGLAKYRLGFPAQRRERLFPSDHLAVAKIKGMEVSDTRGRLGSRCGDVALLRGAA